MWKKNFDAIMSAVMYIFSSLFIFSMAVVIIIIALYTAFFWPWPTIRINNNTPIEIESLSLYIRPLHIYARRPHELYAYSTGVIAQGARVRNMLHNSRIPNYNEVIVIIHINGKESSHTLFADSGLSYERFGSVRININEDSNGLIYLDMRCRVHIGFRYSNRSTVPLLYLHTCNKLL
ncbi:MAG: hypothetical protein FWC92_03465 [Defluviitaleaceae bacterium]|nr:hypothetical protein [Defluviitaleaceae bacterium]